MAQDGRVGTGNIGGVASAIGFGGPGAIFWMWAIAFLGSNSAYIEAALAQVHKEELDGEYRDGPQYYIEKGLGQRWYAIIFSLSAIVDMGFLLLGIQANSIASAMNNAFAIPTWVSGAVITVLLGLIIFGGVERIGKVAEIVVSFIAIRICHRGADHHRSQCRESSCDLLPHIHFSLQGANACKIN
jgi:AGCS family alanine or glycine:cation symporter